MTPDTGLVLMREKTPGLIAELEAADPRLRALVIYAAGLCIHRFGVFPVLVQVHRTRAAEEALHGVNAPISPHEVTPTRAADLRTRGLLTDPQAQAWEDELRTVFQYDPRNPPPHTCATFETQAKALAIGRDPALPPIVPHLHLQVPAFFPGGGSGANVVRLWAGTWQSVPA